MTSGEPEREGAPMPAAWIDEQLRLAVERVDRLQREVEELQAGMRLQQTYIGELRESIATVDGRSLRHEVAQEASVDAQASLAVLEERLHAEAAMRRDLSATVQRLLERGSETERELQRALEVIAQRLTRSEELHLSARERDRHRAVDLAEHGSGGGALTDRLDAIDQRTAATADRGRQLGEDVARAGAAIAELTSSVEAVAARVASQQTEQHRLVEEVGQLRAVRDREEELLDVLDQQRAMRVRVEERLGAVEERTAEIAQASDEAAEERSLLRRQQAGEVERVRGLTELLEAQRLAMVEHLRLQGEANEQSGRRRIEEIERDIRKARGLVVRLAEQTIEASQEQPL